jgi:hypothetical protein
MNPIKPLDTLNPAFPAPTTTHGPMPRFQGSPQGVGPVQQPSQSPPAAPAPSPQPPPQQPPQSRLPAPEPPPPQPWDDFLDCSIWVHKDGELQRAALHPQPIARTDEVLTLLRFIYASHAVHPAAVDWETVPAEIKRHFWFAEEGGEGPDTTEPSS